MSKRQAKETHTEEERGGKENMQKVLFYFHKILFCANLDSEQ